jgi:EAL domain-containing protein (putative c-di-GMP-specific phosphodiesterase class I)
VGDQELALSCSVGIAFYPDHGPRSKLVANADAAMIAAKRAGGGLHCIFEPKMAHDTAQDEIELQRDLRHAIERGELMLYYQPKINARTLQVTGAEALLRWKHPVRGMVSPAVFIPLAERFGLIGNLGHWVLEEACRQVREWLDGGLRVRVAINLSVHQLRQADFVHRIREVFQRHQIDPSLITFEITESVAMEDTQATMHAFERLASAGVILSIDDFGTGYSSLSYLRKLCARQLKIDRSFIQDLNGSADAKAIVEAVIGLAHALGLNVVAEGVETADQQRILQELGCDELQGFLFAKPMPAPQLTLWAREDERPEMASGTGISFSSSVFDAGDFDAVPADFLPTEPHVRD